MGQHVRPLDVIVPQQLIQGLRIHPRESRLELVIDLSIVGVPAAWPAPTRGAHELGQVRDSPGIALGRLAERLGLR